MRHTDFSKQDAAKKKNFRHGQFKFKSFTFITTCVNAPQFCTPKCRHKNYCYKIFQTHHSENLLVSGRATAITHAHIPRLTSTSSRNCRHNNNLLQKSLANKKHDKYIVTKQWQLGMAELEQPFEGAVIYCQSQTPARNNWWRLLVQSNLVTTNPTLTNFSHLRTFSESPPDCLYYQCKNISELRISV